MPSASSAALYSTLTYTDSATVTSLNALPGLASYPFPSKTQCVVGHRLQLQLNLTLFYYQHHDTSYTLVSVSNLSVPRELLLQGSL